MLEKRNRQGSAGWGAVKLRVAWTFFFGVLVEMRRGAKVRLVKIGVIRVSLSVMHRNAGEKSGATRIGALPTASHQ